MLELLLMQESSRMGRRADDVEVQTPWLRLRMKPRGRPECLWQAKIEPTAVGG